MYTDTNVYSINAISRIESGIKYTYLGCIASARKPRAGEDHTRGNDLPDGKLNENTWRQILAAIVGYELVDIKSKKPTIT